MLETIKMQTQMLENLKMNQTNRKPGLFNSRQNDGNPPTQNSKRVVSHKSSPFDLQMGHLGIDGNEKSKKKNEDTHIFEKTEELFVSKNGLEPMHSLLDFKKSFKTLDFKKDLPRLPFPKLIGENSARCAKSYNINWTGVEKRQDLACLPFDKSLGRDRKSVV